MDSQVSAILTQIRAHLSSSTAVIHGFLFGLLAFGWTMWNDLRPSVEAGYELVRSVSEMGQMEAAQKKAESSADWKRSLLLQGQVKLARLQAKLAEVKFQMVTDEAAGVPPGAPSEAIQDKGRPAAVQDSSKTESAEKGGATAKTLGLPKTARLLKKWTDDLRRELAAVDIAKLDHRKADDLLGLIEGRKRIGSDINVNLDATTASFETSAGKGLDKKINIDLPIIKLAVRSSSAIPFMAGLLTLALVLGFVTRCRNWTEINHCMRRHFATGSTPVDAAGTAPVGVAEKAVTVHGNNAWLVGRLPWWMGSLFVSVSVADMRDGEPSWPVKRLNNGMLIVGCLLLVVVYWLARMEWCGAAVHHFAGQDHGFWGAAWVAAAFVSVIVFVLTPGICLQTEEPAGLSAYPESSLRRDLLAVGFGGLAGALFSSLRGVCSSGASVADVAAAGGSNSAGRRPRFVKPPPAWVEVEQKALTFIVRDRTQIPASGVLKKTGDQKDTQARPAVLHFVFPPAATDTAAKETDSKEKDSTEKRHASRTAPPAKPYLLHPRCPKKPKPSPEGDWSPAKLATPGNARINHTNAAIVCEFKALEKLQPHAGTTAQPAVQPDMKGAFEWAMCGIRHDQQFMKKFTTTIVRSPCFRIYDLAAKIAGELGDAAMLDQVVTALEASRARLQDARPKTKEHRWFDICNERHTKWRKTDSNGKNTWIIHCQDSSVLAKWRRPLLPHEIKEQIKKSV